MQAHIRCAIAAIESDHRPFSRARIVARGCLLAAGALAPVLVVPAAAQERPADIIAAHVRMQGYVCGDALAAERNRKASKPNGAVWTLRCNNAVYRVRLVPDMAAHVEPVK